ncbi:MAG: branched-chain amino acid ABC transporter permease [Proteobacteria bacterium]|nr:branched-chain amino acid ABC transporter permease [Pseudomonadota bacterium]
MNVDILVQNIFNALQFGSFYAIIALGYSMVYSILMLFNFAHGDIFMTGTYIALGVATVLLGWALPTWVVLPMTILLAMALTSVIGMVVERVGYRPLRDAPRASAAITGLMIGIMLETGVLALVGGQKVAFPELIKTETIHLGQITLTNIKVMIVVASLVMMAGMHQFVKRTKWGMAMRAMAYDFPVVPLMGVPINNIARMTFGMGSGLAAVAGIMFGLAYPILNPYMGIVYGWKAFVAAILGGRGSIMGACIAGYMLGFIEVFVTMIASSVPWMSPSWRDLISYSIILGILVFRPHGLFGESYSAKLRL